MNKTNVFVANDLDLINKAEATEIIPQHLFSHVLIETTEVNVTRGVALADRKENLARDRAGLTPPNFELLAVKRKFLHGRVGMEGRGGSAIEEGDEDAATFGKNADALDRAKADKVEEFIHRGVGGQVTDVYSPSSSIVGGGSSGGLDRVHSLAIHPLLLNQIARQIDKGVASE